MALSLRTTRLLFALVLVLALFVATIAPRSASASSIPAGSLIYEVTIRGSASGNAFNRVGYVVLTPTITRDTTNGVNPVDVWFVSGNPVVTPQVGAINFATNLQLRNHRSALDVAYVTWDSRTATITVRPDWQYAAIGLNVFNNSSGLLGGIYQIYDGQLQLQLGNGGSTISGTVNFVAKGAYYYFNVPYNATIQGRLVQTT
jgi:hypothetical protein